MKKSVSLFLTLLLSSILLSCSSVTVDDYAGRQPELTLEGFFSGDLVAYGIVRNRSGKVIRYFSAALKGSWDTGIGTLDEVFWFDDGERQTRLWTMTPTGDNEYRGTAGDVEGAALIKVRGNAINLAYHLRVPYQGRDIVLTMDDWMYQVAPGVVMNETLMSKWGFEVGKITLVIMRADVVTAIPRLISDFGAD